ncbi:hypothetical protein EXT42_08695 [Pseudoalteromonas sp. CO302Y]|uniref:DUF4350 domain-containing protein n=1 Tax=unclassified Pseudoalteromonas TaxID=194690 RepID=UPI001022A132|nr:hypothetical protein EXT42_08695 [Pseudoalteromonas sp. CO302Y]RZG09936.1 hypothetical protein EXT40_08705 [Pseudoalteromonas sp. CO133X]
MKLKYFMIGLLVLTVALLGSMLASVKWEKQEVEIGFQPEVAKDSFTLAQRLLASYDVQWHKDKRLASQTNPNQLTIDPNTMLVVDEAVLANSYELDQQLVQWVADGGRLVYVLNRQRDELGIDNAIFFQELGIDVTTVDDVFEFNFVLLEEGSSNTTLTIDETTQLELELSQAFKIDSCQGVQTENQAGDTVMCDLPFGAGRVIVLPSLAPFTNYKLRHLDHGSLLVWLTQGASKVTYVPYLSYPNWLSKLWHWSWQFVVSLLLTVVFAVWHISSRIGRAYAPDVDSKTSFNQHIRAIANFYTEHGHEARLFEALKKDFNAKVETRVPNFKMLSAHKQAEIIASLTQFDKEQVEILLSSELPESREQRTDYIKRYRQLRNAL